MEVRYEKYCQLTIHLKGGGVIKGLCFATEANAFTAWLKNPLRNTREITIGDELIIFSWGGIAAIAKASLKNEIRDGKND